MSEEYLAHSPAVQAICAKYYSERTDCRGCPIKDVCYSGPTGIMTREKIDEHAQRMNEAAAPHGEAGKEGRG